MNGRESANDFALNGVEYVNYLDGLAQLFNFISLPVDGATTESQNQKLVIFGFYTTATNSDEIRPVSIDRGSSLTCHIWP